MTKDKFIRIAKVGFPDRVKQFINFDNLEAHYASGVYRLFDKDIGYKFMLPKETILSVVIGDDKSVQIESGGKAFNHYAAVLEMMNLGIV